MTISVLGTTVINPNRFFTLGTATPGSPVTGMIRFNNVTALFEVYNGTAWVSIAGVSNSSLWTVGYNNVGQLGDNSITNRSSPVSVVGGFTDWMQVSVGNAHAGAVRPNGTAWCWGAAGNGRLGDGTASSRSSPVSVVGGFTDWVQISCANAHTAALRSNGTIWAWGQNNSGQLGDNTTISKSSPVSVVGGFTDWTQVSAAYQHTSAIRANGTAWGWGNSTLGRIGDNYGSGLVGSPVSVVGGFTDWVQISAAFQHTSALRANGTAWAWGNGGYGRLGDNATSARSSPVSVVGGFTDWVQISSGRNHTVALRTNGTVWAWGRNNYGQLGTNSATDVSSPVSVVGGFTDWVQISAGGLHTAALRTTGSAWAWGRNSIGVLGDGTTINRSSPVSVVGGVSDWIQINAGPSPNGSMAIIRTL